MFDVINLVLIQRHKDSALSENIHEVSLASVATKLELVEGAVASVMFSMFAVVRKTIAAGND